MTPTTSIHSIMVNILFGLMLVYAYFHVGLAMSYKLDFEATIEPPPDTVTLVFMALCWPAWLIVLIWVLRENAKKEAKIKRLFSNAIPIAIYEPTNRH